MYKHYLLVSMRSLWQSKINTLINVFGLSIGIMSCVLIFLYIGNEWSYDRFHSKSDRIFRVWVKEDWGVNQKFFNVATPFPLGPALKENFQEVENQVRIHKFGTQVKIDKETFSETLTIAGRDLFEVFDFEILKGERRALHNANAIVINEKTAERYFGSGEPIGKTISVQLGEEFDEFIVTAVVRNIPSNSSIRFYLMISDLNYPKLMSPESFTSEWFNVTPETYVLLREGVVTEVLESKFPAMLRTAIGPEDFDKSHYHAGLQPLTSIHLDNTFPVELAEVSDPRYSYILSGVSLLILLIGCLNYVTLSVATSFKRTKEVGVRKVAGASSRQLRVQFIGESLIITSISLIIGLLLAVLALPIFNDLAGKSLVIRPDLFTSAICIFLITIIGIVAGSYPALILSNLKPALILKSKITGGSRQTIRKLMVGGQLVLSILLISSSIVMQRQLTFLQTKNLGYDKDRLLTIQLNVGRGNRLAERVKEGFERAELFKKELTSLAEIEAVCATSQNFANGSWTSIGFTDDNGTYRDFDLNIIDEDYLPLLKMQFVAGRNFLKSNSSDARRSVIVNEAFVRQYGWPDPLGKRIPGKNFKDHEIVGVVRDFNYESLYTKVSPLAMVMDPAIILAGSENTSIGMTPVPKLIIRLRSGDMQIAISRIEEVWNKLIAGEEFEFRFIDDALESQYRSDLNLGRIMNIATIISVCIVSLGLYALVSLTLQNRIREVTVRKILGASEGSLLFLLSREYIAMVGMALAVAVPMTLLLTMKWLQSFEYRVTVGWDVFVLSGVLTLVLAACAIGYQVIRTTLVNPARSLRQD